ncbi:type II toxin-antitoxin system RelE/ParE family toxin [Paraburkholderia kirstenboschensis]|uniref:type II toxin-antitoxin system RelE/ParE family toxin n=1 Tax=Paraburkholderia kirstenboschensis TaxID=1245436 RepID=UPI000B20E385|nr:type II toxin-antitoxin system RelE/ParE family toxin [Paraburkholderia kirstenboschensis]
MAWIILAPEIRDDFDRIFDFLCEHAPETASTRIDDVVRFAGRSSVRSANGRPVSAASPLRELAFSNGTHGYLALYRCVAELDLVLVVAIRSQRELPYRRLSS